MKTKAKINFIADIIIETAFIAVAATGIILLAAGAGGFRADAIRLFPRRLYRWTELNGKRFITCPASS